MPPTLSRRSFLWHGAAGATLITAACSRTGRSTTSGHIVVANHPVYIDADTNRAFTDATGIAVEYHEEVADDDAWLAAVGPRLERGASIDRDVVVVSDWLAERMALHGWLAPVPHITWALGMVGVAFDRRATTLTSVVELFHEELHGRVALPTDFREALGIALLADRFDPSTVTYDQAAATAGRLANSVRIGQVVLVDRPIDALIDGRAAAVVARASDCVTLLTGAFEFVVPDDGGLLLTDVAVVLASGANTAGGRRYLDFVNDPLRAAERFRVIPAVLPLAHDGRLDEELEAALRRDTPNVLTDPRRNPPTDVRARLRAFRTLDDGEEAAFRALFAQVIHAAG